VLKCTHEYTASTFLLSGCFPLPHFWNISRSWLLHLALCCLSGNLGLVVLWNESKKPRPNPPPYDPKEAAAKPWVADLAHWKALLPVACWKGLLKPLMMGFGLCAVPARLLSSAELCGALADMTVSGQPQRRVFLREGNPCVHGAKITGTWFHYSLETRELFRHKHKFSPAGAAVGGLG